MELQFVVDQVHSALSVDSSKSTHPLSYDVTTPREIRGIFDTITYAKGGSILRMIEKTYGSDVFHGALTDYLDKKYVTITFFSETTNISFISLTSRNFSDLNILNEHISVREKKSLLV